MHFPDSLLPEVLRECLKRLPTGAMGRLKRSSLTMADGAGSELPVLVRMCLHCNEQVRAGPPLESKLNHRTLRLLPLAPVENSQTPSQGLTKLKPRSLSL